MQLFCKGPYEGFGYGLVWDRVPSNFEIWFLLIFFNVFRYFWCTDIKNNFKKIKKLLFWCISKQKVLWTATATTIPNRPMLLPKFYMDTVSWQNQAWTISITACVGSRLGWMLHVKHQIAQPNILHMNNSLVFAPNVNVSCVLFVKLESM
jgi:hypothetical protein